MKKDLKEDQRTKLIFIQKLLVSSSNKEYGLIWKPNSLSFKPLWPNMPVSSSLGYFFLNHCSKHSVCFETFGYRAVVLYHSSLIVTENNPNMVPISSCTSKMRYHFRVSWI